MPRPWRWPTWSPPGVLASILVERIDGTPALQPRAGGPGPVAEALAEAGFARTPRGMRLR